MLECSLEGFELVLFQAHLRGGRDLAPITHGARHLGDDPLGVRRCEAKVVGFVEELAERGDRPGVL
jgi:hypothetical protein